MFVTGRAGTGKSTLLEHMKTINKGKIAVLAPTGIAAINVDGDTIHSFFRLKPGFELDEAEHMRINHLLEKKCNSIDTIFIDEISMVRADILDAIDILLQRARKSLEPFGGVRMIMFGDLFQLPPVITNDDKDAFLRTYKTPYFFSAHLFNDKDLFTPGFNMRKIELRKVYRQREQEFIDMLNGVREGDVSDQDLEFINRRVNSKFIPREEDNYIHLMATNYQASRLNSSKLSKIDSPIINYQAHIEGNIGKLQPTATHIQMKVGAQVMFINNDSKKRWVNGTIGTVLGLEIEIEEGVDIEVLRVELSNGKTVKVTPFTWEISRYVFEAGKLKREVDGFFTQIPLILAWAVTIHKSQGKSFDKVLVDLGSGSFAHGQTYVALSRCTTIDGLVLRSPIKRSDIIVDCDVLEFNP